MARITTREVVRLLMVAFGVLCSLVATISSLSLLRARTEQGVVQFYATLYRGEQTNVASVVWGSGVHLHLEPGDLSHPPKAGDTVQVLVIGKAGTLKYGRSFWRTWISTGSFAVAGVALLIGGLYVLRRRPLPHEIRVRQAV